VIRGGDRDPSESTDPIDDDAQADSATSDAKTLMRHAT